MPARASVCEPLEACDVGSEHCASATCGGGADGVETALVQARELIDLTVSLHQVSSRDKALSIVAAHDPAEVGNTVDTLLSRARSTAAVVVAAGNGGNTALDAVLLSRLGTIHGRGLSGRLLYSSPDTDPARFHHPARRPSGPEIRSTRVPLGSMLIVDERAALVQASRRAHSGSMVVIEDPVAVRTLALLQADVWACATRVTDSAPTGHTLRSRTTLRVLECLRAGYIDDVAARELRVSLRTYRRHVAEIMKKLGATSRFHAGVRAVELGLLSPEE
jgi:DNA-binding CsgD family transcriptional regulator